MTNQTSANSRPARERAPHVDIYENESEYLVVADVPGLDPQDIDVRVDLPEFRLEAKVPGADGAVIYARTFRVDERVDPERVNAEYRDGVLHVHLAKSAAFRPRRVAVQAS